MIDNLNDDEIYNLQNHCINTKIFHYKKLKNNDTFQNIFKNKIKHLLEILIKNYGRAAGLYYYEKEKNNEQPKHSQRRIRLASPYTKINK